MTGYEDDVKYIQGLYKRYPYIDEKNVEKVISNLFKDKYLNDDYYTNKLLDEIYIVLSSVNTYISTRPESRETMFDYKEVVLENVFARLNENIRFLNTELYKVERNYKEDKQNNKADIEEDLYSDIELLDRVKQITEAYDDIRKALRCASKEGIEDFVKYYNYKLSLESQINAQTLFNATQGVLWGTSFQYLGKEFIDKQAFKVDCDEFLWLYQRLEQCIEEFDIQSDRDPKFEDFKNAYIKDIVLFDKNGNQVTDDDVKVELTKELKQSILNYANEQCDYYCLLREYLDMWLPRALAPMEDGCFIVTRNEVENHINIVALASLKYEYPVMFNFYKKAGIELTLSDNIKDMALYYLQSEGVSLEDLNAVYKRKDLDNRQPITYEEISKEFLDAVKQTELHTNEQELEME